jgi:hypothetical protein
MHQLKSSHQQIRKTNAFCHMREKTHLERRQNLFSIWKRQHVERKKSNSDLLGGELHIFWHAPRRLRGRLGGDGGISVGARDTLKI